MDATKRLRELHGEIQNILEGGIEQFLLPYANDDKPLYIYVQGFTPSFNDGQPCEHESYYYTPEEVVEERYHDDEEQFIQLTEAELLNSRKWPDDQDFTDALNATIEALEYEYKTGYQVLITLKDNNVFKVKEYYESDY